MCWLVYSNYRRYVGQDFIIYLRTFFRSHFTKVAAFFLWKYKGYFLVYFEPSEWRCNALERKITNCSNDRLDRGLAKNYSNLLTFSVAVTFHPFYSFFIHFQINLERHITLAPKHHKCSKRLCIHLFQENLPKKEKN